MSEPTGVELLPPAQVDAWVFLGVAYGAQGGPASMVDVIGAMDWINHALPTEGEFTNGINRLLARDLIDVTGGSFVLTDDGRGLLRRLKSRSVHGQWDLFVAGYEPPPATGTWWEPRPGEIREAVRDYVKRANASMRANRGRRGARPDV